MTKSRKRPRRRKRLVLVLPCGPAVAEVVREVLKVMVPMKLPKPNGHDVST
jgi:hypothetical protein